MPRDLVIINTSTHRRNHDDSIFSDHVIIHLLFGYFRLAFLFSSCLLIFSDLVIINSIAKWNAATSTSF